MAKKKEPMQFKVELSEEEVKRVERLKEILEEIKSLPSSDTLFVGFDAPKRLEALRNEYKELSKLIAPLEMLEGSTSNILDGFGIQIGKLSIDLGKVASQLNKMFDSASYSVKHTILEENIKAELLALENKNIAIVKQEEEKNNEIQKNCVENVSKQKEIIDEGKRAWVFDIDDAIKQYETEIGELWKFTEEGQELYQNYFAAKKSLYEAEGKDILEVYREQKDFENETTKFYQERERASVEEKYNEDKIALKNQLADGIITREEYAQKQEELTIRYLEDEIALRNSYGKDTIDLEEQLADMRLTIREREEEETAKANAAVADVEKDSQKTRLEQWKDYAEKAAEISQKIGEGTKMVTDSLGSMFGQLGSYYADQVQAFTDKINALDEEKEAALERVALSEEERQAKENEIGLQKIELEYATSEEQRIKADERIATLQGELSAEDTINREFGDKKTQLEKEKAKKEKEQKKAEKMEKRLQMSQAIVEAVGNVAAGAAKALTYGPILGPIMAAIVAAAGAVQVGIMTKQLTKMKDGGLLRGFPHSQGGMRIMGSNVEVEGGEYVINKQSTSKNLGLLEYINGERRGLRYSDMNTFFGQTPSTPSFLTQMMNEPSVVPQLPMKDSVDTQILSAIERINFQPRVSVTDINTVHDNMVKVDEWTGL